MFAHTNKQNISTYILKTKKKRLSFLVFMYSLFIYESDSKVSLQSMEKLNRYKHTKTNFTGVKKNAGAGDIKLSANEVC